MRSCRRWTPGTLPWRHVRAGGLGARGQGGARPDGPSRSHGPGRGGAGAAPVPPFLRGPRRKALYQRAPRNIHRHVVLSEIKEAVAALPPVSGGCPGSFLCAGFPPRAGHVQAPSPRPGSLWPAALK